MLVLHTHHHSEIPSAISMEIGRLEELNNRLISILNSLILIIILQEWYVEKEANNGMILILFIETKAKKVDCDYVIMQNCLCFNQKEKNKGLSSAWGKSFP